jgi:hypothetical protein
MQAAVAAMVKAFLGTLRAGTFVLFAVARCAGAPDCRVGNAVKAPAILGKMRETVEERRCPAR